MQTPIADLVVFRQKNCYFCSMKLEPNTVRIDSIEAYNRLYGLQTSHPLVSVVNLSLATHVVNHIYIDYGIYALFLKDGASCAIKYGRQSYDYQEGTVVSFSPGQLIELSTVEDEIAPDVIGLLFHPDVFYKTTLALKIKEYSFFEYSQREALHLSPQERNIFIDTLKRIKSELDYPIDKHSVEILTSQIQVLLDYLSRFYDRQFMTRNKANSKTIESFESDLKEYLKSGMAKFEFPSVNYFAKKVNLTPGYFGDLIKKETGLTPQYIISQRMIEYAKHRLATTSDDISQIAYDLGFQHPQHFARKFKSVTGMSPTQFRESVTGRR